MSDRETEACGRCSMSTVVDVASDAESCERDPFGESRIEVDDDQLQRVSPGAWMGRLTTRLNEFARKLTYDR